MGLSFFAHPVYVKETRPSGSPVRTGKPPFFPFLEIRPPLW